MKSEYHYILFDWDGTLVQTLDVWSDALRHSLKRHGYTLSRAQIGADYQKFAERAAGLGITDSVELTAILAEARERIRATENDAALYEGVREVLGDLRAAQKKLGIVTTSIHAQVDRRLREWDIASFFDVVVCGDDVARHKPNAEPVERAMQQLSAARSRTVMVGDSTNDIKAAQSAGVASVLYFPPRHARFYQRDELESLHPTWIIERLEELLGVV